MRNHEVASFSIGKELKKELEEYCKINYINKSKIVEKIIIDFLEKNGIKT